jgi:hypothetical protein
MPRFDEPIEPMTLGNMRELGVRSLESRAGTAHRQAVLASANRGGFVRAEQPERWSCRLGTEIANPALPYGAGAPLRATSRRCMLGTEDARSISEDSSLRTTHCRGCAWIASGLRSGGNGAVWRRGLLGACLSIRRILLAKEVRVGFFWPHEQDIPCVEDR